MSTIYNILKSHEELMRQMDEAEGELSPEIETALALSEQDVQEKCTSLAYVSKTYEDSNSAIDAEIARLTALKKRNSNRISWIEGAVKTAMLTYGLEEIKINNLKISFRKSEAVEITDLSLVPKEFLREIPAKSEPNKVAIKTAIKEGGTVAGCELKENKNLQIK